MTNSRALLRFARTKPLGAAGGVIVLVLILCGLLAHEIAPYRYDHFDVSQRLEPPSSQHWFGTDEQGRDVFSRVIYGAQSSILIGFGAVAISAVISISLGLVSGFYGGWVDLSLQRLVDVWLAFPGVIFVILVVSVLSNSGTTLVLTMGTLLAAGSSRIVRAAVLAIREMSWVEAARAAGARDGRLVMRGLLPNIFPIVIVNASIQVGIVILLETTLSFLGFGPPPPFPSWGRMLSEAQTQMLYHPNLAVFPGLAITVAVYAFNIFGDALRDVLDPRLRSRG